MQNDTLERFANELREQQWEMKVLVMNLAIALGSEVYWASRFAREGGGTETEAAQKAVDAVARQLKGIKVDKLVRGVVDDLEIVAGLQARTGEEEKRALIERFRSKVGGGEDA